MKQPFDKQKVIDVITKCQKHFNEGRLFYGNCGTFAIALSKWLSETFEGNFGLMAPIVVFDNDLKNGDEVNLSDNFVEFNHVFSVADIAGKYILFDGSGEVSKPELKYWYKDTLKWYKECGFDWGPGRAKIVNAFGNISSGEAIWAVEQGTDPTTDTEDFYDFIKNINNVLECENKMSDYPTMRELIAHLNEASKHIEVDTITAPSVWASYLVNGDASGLDEEEKQLADEWIANHYPWSVVSTEGEPYFTWHYKLHGGNAEGGEVQDYVVHKT
jgi:hypothetical protein